MIAQRDRIYCPRCGTIAHVHGDRAVCALRLCNWSGSRREAFVIARWLPDNVRAVREDLLVRLQRTFEAGLRVRLHADQFRHINVPWPFDEERSRSPEPS